MAPTLEARPGPGNIGMPRASAPPHSYVPTFPFLPEARCPRSWTSLIAPEIRDDALAAAIRRIAALPSVRVMLEVGSSTGEGSTDAFVAGAMENPAGPPTLHCLELSRGRFEQLQARHGGRGFVHCHRTSSVRLERFADADDIARFCAGFKPWLRRRSKARYREWLEQDRRYAMESGVDTDGIRDIARRFGIDRFDAVLIDGSEFTGGAVLDDVYGAEWILLDDIRAMKNHATYRRLRADPAYRMEERSWWLRNGFAIFKKV